MRLRFVVFGVLGLGLWAIACGGNGGSGGGDGDGVDAADAPGTDLVDATDAPLVDLGTDPGTDPGRDAPSCTDPGPAQLSWTPCHETFECATLAAPVDYADPCGVQVALALVRAPAQVPALREGMIVVNPGGPGVAALSMVLDGYENLRLVSGDLLDRQDLVAMDPRGVGASDPIDCVGDADLDALRALAPAPAPGDEAGWTALDARLAQFANGCAAGPSAGLLRHVDTANVARDLDRLRAAVGDPTISFLGVSYGTYLGATYASLFPDRVRAFVLDSAVPPLPGGNEEFVRTLATGYEAALQRFFEDCGADAGCAFHGGQGAAAVAAAYDGVAGKATAEPLTAADGRPLSPMELGAALWGTLRPADWSALAAALKAAEAGDAAPVMQRADTFFERKADGHYSSFLEALWAVQLLDFGCPAGYDLAAHRALVAELRATAPRMGGMISFFLAGCIHWPVTRDAPAPAINAHGAPPLLVIASRLDPATPHAWAEALVAALGNGSHLLTWEGEGHVATSHSLCAALAGLDFLRDPATPPASLSCPK